MQNISEQEWPTVSLITVNYDGLNHLRSFFPSAFATDYPADRLEVILVDNGSTDTSLSMTREQFPGVRVIETGANLGYSAGLNMGVAAATGDIVALLNNDMRFELGWLKALVRPLVDQDDVACTAARIVSWDGKTIDYAGSMANCFGYGYQRGFGWPTEILAQDRPEFTLFACGGAMAVRRAVYLEAGGFDDDYFMFYEDVDFGWRLWVLGHKILYVPDAIVYHHHHGSASKLPTAFLQLLYARNALKTIIKNYDDEHLSQVLPVALLLHNKRALGLGKVDRAQYDRGREPARGDATLPQAAVVQLLAMGDIADDMGALWVKRRDIQARRARPDREVLPLLKMPFGPISPEPEAHMAQQQLSFSAGLVETFSPYSEVQVAILTHEPITTHMAGPAIRCYELARVLSATCRVTLLAPNADPLAGDGFLVASHAWDEARTRAVVNGHDVLITQGFMLNLMPSLMQLGRRIVVDLYDPFTLANLHTYASLPLPEQVKRDAGDLAALNAQLAVGDFFMCGSEQQRDYWLGMLSANGRLNPLNHAQDSTFRSLIDVVSFGISATPPARTRAVLKGVYPGIGADDIVLLWGGGIWDWFDPLSLIEAMGRIREQRPRVKLFFLGTKSPNPHVQPTQMTGRAIELAKRLGVFEETVFFNDWAAYEDRQNYLREADLGVSLHFDHIETRFSLRTRLFDYIWADLPILTSRGDAMSRLVEQHGLGVTVNCGDVEDIVRQLLRLTEDGDLRGRFRANFEAIKPRLVWERVAEPLAVYCRAPHHASDKLYRHHDIAPRQMAALQGSTVALQASWTPPSWYSLPGRAVGYLSKGGVAGLRKATAEHFHRRRKLGVRSR